MRKKFSKRLFLIIGITAIFAVVGGFTYSNIVKGNTNQKEQLIQIKENVKNLEVLAGQDISSIQNKINKIAEDIRKKEQEELRKIEQEKERIEEEKRAKEQENVELNYKAIFRNTAFMGDSIMEGLQEYGFINKYTVFANKGDTVVKAIGYSDKVISSHPQHIVLLYGMNDIVSFNAVTQSDATENFKKNYIQLVEMLKQGLPNAKIYLQAPLSVIDSIAIATNRNINMQNILKIREVIKEVANETNVVYMDIPQSVQNHEEYVEPDGIHYKYIFYKLWLNSIAKKIS